MAKRIVVIGGGIAGLTSALTACRQGAEVVLLEAREWCSSTMPDPNAMPRVARSWGRIGWRA